LDNAKYSRYWSAVVHQQDYGAPSGTQSAVEKM
jgi:hypothetical protein